MPRGRWPTLMVLTTSKRRGVDHRDGVALLVGHEGGAGLRRAVATKQRRAAAIREPKAGNRSACISSQPGSFQPALVSGRSIAERIELGDLVQKSLLRRHRDDHRGRRRAGSAGAAAGSSRRKVSFWPLKAASAKCRALDVIEQILAGSADRVRVAASPMIRTADQACMSRAVMRRENLRDEPVLHLDTRPTARGTRPSWSARGPAEPATGRASQVR